MKRRGILIVVSGFAGSGKGTLMKELLNQYDNYALSISATTDDYAKRALEKLPELRGCEAHSSVILSQIDSSVFKKLGVNMTCEPLYQSKKLYHG